MLFTAVNPNSNLSHVAFGSGGWFSLDNSVGGEIGTMTVMVVDFGSGVVVDDDDGDGDGCDERWERKAKMRKREKLSERRSQMREKKKINAVCIQR